MLEPSKPALGFASTEEVPCPVRPATFKHPKPARPTPTSTTCARGWPRHGCRRPRRSIARRPAAADGDRAFRSPTSPSSCTTGEPGTTGGRSKSVSTGSASSARPSTAWASTSCTAGPQTNTTPQNQTHNKPGSIAEFVDVVDELADPEDA